jgi:hypothetical protein
VRRVLAAALALVAVAAVASMPGASGVVPTPTLSEPPAGLKGYPLWDSYYDLAPFGYEEEEFFVSGTAQDAAGTPAPYTTRIIVTRPTDAARFNGTVLLDWVNVTAQFENAVDTMLAREMLMREGFAYVHVSAQKAGIESPLLPLTLKGWDLARYGALNHPGDEWSFDMVTQVARAFEAPGGVDPMAGLSVERILAAGQSQSANRLADYVESWLPTHPEAVGVIDGILVHGNVPGEKAFAAAAPVPVLQLLSDYEAEDDGVAPASLGPNHRLWEIAGAAHADYFIGYQSEFGHGPRVTVGAPKVSQAQYQEIINAAGNYGEVVSPLMAVCTAAGATMPMHYATSTAIHQLDAWVATGTGPASGPRFQFAGGALASDEHGNTLGGIRLPPIDVPVARYVSTICQLGGITIPFTDVQIQGLYGTHAAYYAQMAEKSDAAVSAGWLLPTDAVDLMRRVCAASVRFQLGPADCPAYVPVAFNQARVAPGALPAPAPAPATAAGRLPVTGDATSLLVALGLAAVAITCRRVHRVAA